MLRLKPAFLLGLLAIIAVSLLVVACGDDDDDSGNNGGGTATATSSGGAAKKGGSITIVYPEPESFDPHYSSFAQDIGVQRMVFRGLYKLNKDLKPEPEMAASLPTISSDGKTYTVKIRSGLKWSDGAPLTAKDFVAGFQRTCDPDNAGNYKDTISNIVGCDEFYAATKASDTEKAALRDKVGVKATDDTTVEIKL